MTERGFISEKIYDLFHLILEDTGYDLPIIFENQNGVRPTPPFLSISFDSVKSLGTTPYVPPKKEKNIEKVHIPIERLMTLRGFSEDSEKAVNLIKSYCEFETYFDILKKDGLSIVKIEDVVENSNRISEDDEIFYSMEFTIAYIRVVENRNEYIGSTLISGQYKDETEIRFNQDILIEEEQNG